MNHGNAAYSITNVPKSQLQVQPTFLNTRESTPHRVAKALNGRWCTVGRGPLPTLLLFALTGQPQDNIHGSTSHVYSAACGLRLFSKLLRFASLLVYMLKKLNKYFNILFKSIIFCTNYFVTIVKKLFR
jgi:hypothetical protein